MKKASGVLVLGFMILVFNSCSYDDGNLVYPTSDVNDSITTVISFTKDIQPIMVTYCLGLGNQHCHVTNTNQGSNGDFTTYAGVKAKVDNGSIIARAINPGCGMPPSYSTGPIPLSVIDKMKIQSWISNGAPNN